MDEVEMLQKALQHRKTCTKELAQCMICINLLDVGCFIEKIFSQPDEYLGYYDSNDVS